MENTKIEKEKEISENEIKKEELEKNNNQEQNKPKLTINHIQKEDVIKDAEELNFLSMRLGEIQNLEDCSNLKVI